jgi:threonine dehydrogenase-like Zn-dependent dehydrogenase
MKGVIFTGDRGARVKDFPVPDPAPGEVLIKMKAASICGTDMHFYRKSWEELVAFRESFHGSADTITGHEPCGIVESIGSKVAGVKPGDRVTVYQHIGCGRCGFCRRGDVMFCPDRRGYGSAYDGSAADYILAPERNCLPLPDALSFERAVVLACAGGTAYQSIKRIEASGADTVAVFGLGPVGLCGVMFAAARGARVIGLDMVKERLDLAKKVGAFETVDVSKEDPVEKVMDLTGGKGVDGGADYSGNPNAQEAMLACAGKGARLAVVGVGESFRVDTLRLMIMRQLHLQGSWIYNMGLHEEFVDFVLRKDLPVESLITHRYKIEDGVQAFEEFDTGKTGKVLFTWED